MGFHFLLQGNLPDPGIEPRSPALEADALTSEPPGKAFKGLVPLLLLKEKGKKKNNPVAGFYQKTTRAVV